MMHYVRVCAYVRAYVRVLFISQVSKCICNSIVLVYCKTNKSSNVKRVRYIYIYIYIEREREREGGREKER